MVDTPDESEAPALNPDSGADEAEPEATESEKSEKGSANTESPAKVESPGSAKTSWRRRHWRPLAILSVILIPILIFAAWAAITLSYAFSTGERAGYAQKLSHRGWLCKTWEGELAMVNLPGAMPEIFRFSVRNDSIAKLLERNLGKRVSLSYSQHRGVPTSCFGETEYYITNVRILEP